MFLFISLCLNVVNSPDFGYCMMFVLFSISVEMLVTQKTVDYLDDWFDSTCVSVQG